MNVWGAVAGWVGVVVLAAAAPQAPARGEGGPRRFVGERLTNPWGLPSAEPGVAVGGDGTVWVTGIVGGRPPVPSPQDTRFPGTGAWRSSDGGRTFAWDADPVGPGPSPVNLPFAGGDSDVAAAPEGLRAYVASLWPGGISLAVREPEGWVPLPLVSPPGPADRPWVGAWGACTAVVAYRYGPRWLVQRVNPCLAEAEPPRDPVGPAAQAMGLLTAGKVVVDTGSSSPRRGWVYLPLEACAEPPPPGGGCSGVAEVLVAVGPDGGRAFELRPVARTANGRLPIWGVQAATDAAGTLYVAWHDDHDAFLAASPDGGRSWSGAVRLNPEGTTAVYPVVAGGGAGEVNVAWYGTDRAGDANDPAAMGLAGDPASAPWSVWWAESTDGGRTFERAEASPVVHRGVLCTMGVGCPDSSRTRSLLDNFGIVIHPVTGKAVIAYTTDQPEGDLEHASLAYAAEV